MENYELEMNKPDSHCPVIDINGVIEKGKQFDLDITLPEDSRDVIYGTIKNIFKEPIKNAVVKLLEIDYGKDGKKKTIPISHAITDKYGNFVFGPLCPGKRYSLDIWVNDVRHYKISAKCKHEGDCLKPDNVEECNNNC